MNVALLVFGVGVLRIPVFPPFHVSCAPTLKGACLVTPDDVSHSGGHKYFCASHTRCAYAVYDDLDISHLLANYLESIDQSCNYYDRSAVLSVVGDRYVEFFLETAFYFKAPRNGIVFQIYSAK